MPEIKAAHALLSYLYLNILQMLNLYHNKSVLSTSTFIIWINFQPFEKKQPRSLSKISYLNLIL